MATTGLKEFASLSKGSVFVSTEQTGTGSNQNIAHGAARVPALVVAIGTTLTGGAYAILYGTHDATNIVVNCTNNEKFQVLAFFSDADGAA